MSAHEPSDRERIEALERVVELQGDVIASMVDLLAKAAARLSSIQRLLVRNNLLDRAEIDEQASRLDEDADLTVELAPEHEEFRRIRRRMQELADDAEHKDD
jgi:hypothetical protein